MVLECRECTFMNAGKGKDVLLLQLCLFASGPPGFLAEVVKAAKPISPLGEALGPELLGLPIY